MTSPVLLHPFMTGLCPDIGCQFLLKEKPFDFSSAQKDALNIKYALKFGISGDSIFVTGSGKSRHLSTRINI